jgi:hypothetical protein
MCDRMRQRSNIKGRLTLLSSRNSFVRGTSRLPRFRLRQISSCEILATSSWRTEQVSRWSAAKRAIPFQRAPSQQNREAIHAQSCQLVRDSEHTAVIARCRNEGRGGACGGAAKGRQRAMTVSLERGAKSLNFRGSPIRHANR